MKRLIVLTSLFTVFAFMAMTANVQAQSSDNVTLDFVMTVDEYIEVMEAPENATDFGITSHETAWGYNNEGLISEIKSWNLAYANCPFDVTIEGNNDMGQGKPRFAREEVGPAAQGYDFLNTAYYIGVFTNGEVQQDNFGWQWAMGAESFPRTGNYDEAPHNGQVELKMKALVNSYNFDEKDVVPVRRTDINPGQDNRASADAGLYSCSMTITLSAL